VKRATYEISFSPSTAAFARFARALVTHDAQLLCSYSMPGGGSVVASIKVDPSRAAQLAQEVRPIHFRYRSPTVSEHRREAWQARSSARRQLGKR
jgi:hypothetical protein